MKRTPVFLFFISIFCLLFLFSCGKVDKTEDIQPSEGIPEASQEFTEQAVGEKLAAEAVIQGIVTFASGVVTIERDGDWEILDVEDLVGLDDRVKTDSESYCELQFEEFGIMRIQENTEITVSEIYLKEDENRVNVKLDGGKLLCKVKKLSKGEEFQVKTSTALAGVRGTEFMVDAKEDQSVRVAVKEGEVSVVPTEIAEKLEQIKGELKTETAKEVMEEITFSEIIVTEDREMELAPQDTEEALREFEAVTEVIEKKMKKIDDKAFTLEERQKAIDEANEPVSEKERQVIQKLEGDIEVLKKDVITVTEVESSLVQDGLQKSVEIKESTQIELQEIEKMETKPILIASKSETVKERVEDTDEKGPALTKVSVQVTPEDGKLTINNKESGRGKISGLFMPETKLSIKAEREGYITEEQEITVLEQTLQYIKIELVPEPISWKQKVSDSPFVRGVAIAGNKIVSADAEGTVHCISMTGKNLWSVKTKNNPNNNSMPVIVDDRVMFSGSRVLVIVDLKSGKMIKSISLGADDFTSHLFGRRVTKYNGSILYPSDNALIVLDANTLEEKARVELPGGSKSSPAVYKDYVIIASQRGELLKINPEENSIASRIESSALQPVSGAPAIEEDKAVFAGRGGSVVLADLVKNVKLWETSIDISSGVGIFQDVVFGDNAVFPHNGGSFCALSLKNGAEIYKPVASTCVPLHHEGKLYFGNSKKEFIVMDASSGKILKRYQLDSKITAQPALYNNDVIVATESGMIYRLNPGSM